MSFAPFISGLDDDILAEIVEEIPMAKEYAWNFEKDEFLLRNGKMFIVEGAEAVKIWCYKALKTERYKYYAYSWDFGNEIISLIGSEYSKDAIESEVNRYVQEALQVSPYVVSAYTVDVQLKNDHLTTTVVINTIYGEVEIIV